MKALIAVVGLLFSVNSFAGWSYLLIESGDVQPGTDRVIVTGKPGGTLTVDTNCAVGGMFPNGATFYEQTLVLAGNNGKPGRMPVSTFANAERNPGSYADPTWIDRGTCTQSSKTYNRYQLNLID